MTVRLVLYAILVAVMTVSWASTCVIYRAAELGDLLAPMEIRHSGNLDAVVVGSGNGFENPERMGPAIAIGWGPRLLLVDAGRGVAEALRSAGIPLNQPEAVLLTSLLPENTVGLDDLLLTGWRVPRLQPLRVFGPAGTTVLCESMMRGHQIGIEAEARGRGLPPEGARLNCFDVDPGWTAELDDLVILASDLPGGPLPALAWRFTRKGRSIAIAGAGWAPEAVIEAAMGADVLFHEATIIPDADTAEEAGITIDPELLRIEAKLHTALVDVGGIAARAKVGKLVLLRMKPPPFYNLPITVAVSQTFDGEIIIAADGEEIKTRRP